MYEIIRQAITAHILASRDANNPSLIVVFENDPFDYTNPPPFYVWVDISFEGAEALGMSNAPQSREHGVVHCAVVCQEGTGTAGVSNANDWLKETLGYPLLAPGGAAITFEAFRPRGSETHKGWYRSRSRSIFHADPA